MKHITRQVYIIHDKMVDTYFIKCCYWWQDDKSDIKEETLTTCKGYDRAMAIGRGYAQNYGCEFYGVINND